MLIQAFVPTGKDEYELVVREDLEATNEVNQYITDLSKNNPKLGHLMQELWDSIRLDPEKYRDKNVSNTLEEMIHETERDVIQDFSEKWHIEEDQLAYVVTNYNPKRKRQYGEAELKETADYKAYKETTEKPVPKLRYWKTVRNEFEEVMEKEILPLKHR